MAIRSSNTRKFPKLSQKDIVLRLVQKLKYSTKYIRKEENKSQRCRGEKIGVEEREVKQNTSKQKTNIYNQLF